MGTPIRIELLDDEIAWTDERSKIEHVNALAAGAVPKNSGPTDEAEALQIRIIGNRCECAAYKWAKPVQWNIVLPWKRRQPDLHDFIDVKGVPKPTHNLIVYRDAPPEWAYLLVDGSAHPYYDIIGWCWGFEAQSLPLQERKAGRINHFVDRGDPLLKDPELLKLVLRERQEFPDRRKAYEMV